MTDHKANEILFSKPHWTYYLKNVSLVISGNTQITVKRNIKTIQVMVHFTLHIFIIHVTYIVNMCNGVDNFNLNIKHVDFNTN